jgi:hypothetical protein
VDEEGHRPEGAAMMYLAMIPNYWGRGGSALVAFNKARSVAGKKPVKKTFGKRIIFSYDSKVTTKCFVDEMGYLNWTGVEPKRIESHTGAEATP